MNKTYIGLALGVVALLSSGLAGGVWILKSHVAAVEPCIERVQIYESAAPEQLESLKRLDKIASLFPCAEVVNYSWQWGTTAQRLTYFNHAADLGLTIDPVLYDYVLLDQSTGLKFVEEAKQNNFRGLGRWMILDESLPVGQVSALIESVPAAKGLEVDEARLELVELRDDHGLLSNYLLASAAFNYLVHRIDPTHPTFGIAECYISTTQERLDLTAKLQRLLMVHESVGAKPMDEIGCDSYSDQVANIGLAVQALVDAAGQTKPTFVMQIAYLGDGYPPMPSKELMSATLKAILDHGGPKMEIGLYSFLNLADPGPANDRQLATVQQLLREADLIRR